jgi:DnaJ-class molecular chaperone
MNHMLYATAKTRENPCPACLGSGLMYESMMRKPCRLCNGDLKISDIKEEDSTAVTQQLPSTPRRGRPKKMETV